MYHIFYSHQYINNTTCIDKYMLWEKDRTTMKQSCIGYFTFYNKSELHCTFFVEGEITDEQFFHVSSISLFYIYLLCLPFERRETYCFSMIFSSASASASDILIFWQLICSNYTCHSPLYKIYGQYHFLSVYHPESNVFEFLYMMYVSY